MTTRPKANETTADYFMFYFISVSNGELHWERKVQPSAFFTPWQQAENELKYAYFPNGEMVNGKLVITYNASPRYVGNVEKGGVVTNFKAIL